MNIRLERSVSWPLALLIFIFTLGFPPLVVCEKVPSENCEQAKVGVAVGVFVLVGVLEGVDVEVGVLVFDGVLVLVGVSVSVAVAVDDGVNVAVGGLGVGVLPKTSAGCAMEREVRKVSTTPSL